MIPTYRPTAQQELLLQAALLSGEAARDAWRRAHVSVALDSLDGASESLLPLVYRDVAGLGGDVPGIDALKERYLHTWRESLRFYHGVLPLLQAFEQAGIEAAVLKGLALIARFYRDP